MVHGDVEEPALSLRVCVQNLMLFSDLQTRLPLLTTGNLASQQLMGLDSPLSFPSGIFNFVMTHPMKTLLQEDLRTLRLAAHGSGTLFRAFS